MSMVTVIAFNVTDAKRIIKNMRLREAYGEGNVFTASEPQHFCGRHKTNVVVSKKAEELSNYRLLREAAREVTCNSGGVVVEEI